MQHLKLCTYELHIYHELHLTNGGFQITRCFPSKCMDDEWFLNTRAPIVPGCVSNRGKIVCLSNKQLFKYRSAARDCGTQYRSREPITIKISSSYPGQMLDTIYAIKRLLFTFDLNISIEYGIKFKWDWLRDSKIALGICCKPESLPLCYGLYDIMGFLFQISRIFLHLYRNFIFAICQYPVSTGLSNYLPISYMFICWLEWFS